VALKLLAPQHLGDPTWEHRLRWEGEACARLRHPNLIELREAGTDDQLGPYLVTELLRGQSLRELLAEQGPLPPPVACALVAQLLAGLEAMHAAGFVHRDLKPENVMLTEEGRVVIVDLGLSWHAAHSRVTREGCVAGSVPYMSPEQIQGGAITPRCDVWSLGVMLYELIAGRRPFQRALPGEEVAAVLSAAHAPLDEADRRVSSGLAGLVGACLALDPGRRPAAAGAVRAGLQRLEDLDPELDLARGIPAVMAEATERQHARWRERAERAVAAGESFAALDAIDRALAYRPDADLQELVERATQLAPGPHRRRPSRLWMAAAGAALLILPLALVAALVTVWGMDAAARPSAPVAKPLSARETARSKAAEKAFYRDAARLVRVMGKGARQRALKNPDRGIKQRMADEGALQIVEGMAGLFADVGSDKERVPGTDVSPDGQEAAGRMMRGLLHLFTAGVM
jgi:serine/threonine-protein kinase